MALTPRDIDMVAAEVLSVEELGAHALPALEHLAGANGSLLYRYDAGGRLRFLGGSLAEAVGSYGPELQRTDPNQQVYDRFGSGPRLVPASALAGEAHRRSPAYDEVYGPNDLEHLVCLWLTEARPGQPGMTGVLLTRGRREGPFEDGAHRRISATLPGLCAAVRRDGRIRGLRDAGDGLAAIAGGVPERYLAVDRNEHVLWEQPAVHHLLGGDPGTVPKPLAGPIRAIFQDGEERMVEVERAERLVRAHVRLARLPSCRDVAVVRLVEPDDERWRAGLDGFAAHHDLTRVERRVMLDLALGRTNRQIAERHGVSIETTRTHVKHILSKLGVQTRTQAAQRLWAWEEDAS